jgi:hypothetical protein
MPATVTKATKINRKSFLPALSCQESLRNRACAYRPDTACESADKNSHDPITTKSA